MKNFIAILMFSMIFIVGCSSSGKDTPNHITTMENPVMSVESNNNETSNEMLEKGIFESNQIEENTVSDVATTATCIISFTLTDYPGVRN